MTNAPTLNADVKKITFTPHQYMLEGGSIKSKLQRIFSGTKKASDSFIKPGLKMATPLISAAVAAKTKNPQSAQVTNSILKSLTGGKDIELNRHAWKRIKIESDVKIISNIVS